MLPYRDKLKKKMCSQISTRPSCSYQCHSENESHGRKQEERKNHDESWSQSLILRACVFFFTWFFLAKLHSWLNRLFRTQFFVYFSVTRSNINASVVIDMKDISKWFLNLKQAYKRFFLSRSFAGHTTSINSLPLDSIIGTEVKQ